MRAGETGSFLADGHQTCRNSSALDESALQLPHATPSQWLVGGVDVMLGHPHQKNSEEIINFQLLREPERCFRLLIEMLWHSIQNRYTLYSDGRGGLLGIRKNL